MGDLLIPAEGNNKRPSTDQSWVMLYARVSHRNKRCDSHSCLISVSEGLRAACVLLYPFWRFDSHPTPSLWEAGGKCTCLKVSSQLKLGKPAESSSGLFHNQLSMTSVETQEISLPSPCSYTYLSCQSFVWIWWILLTRGCFLFPLESTHEIKKTRQKGVFLFFKPCFTECLWKSPAWHSQIKQMIVSITLWLNTHLTR